MRMIGTTTRKLACRFMVRSFCLWLLFIVVSPLPAHAKLELEITAPPIAYINNDIDEIKCQISIFCFQHDGNQSTYRYVKNDETEKYLRRYRAPKS